MRSSRTELKKQQEKQHLSIIDYFSYEEVQEHMYNWLDTLI